MTEETEAAARPELRRARQRIVAAIEAATEARTLMGGDPAEGLTPRDVSIAITHLEDALLRLRHGTPS